MSGSYVVVPKKLLETLEDAFRDGRAAVFCGAGISAPSGIPLAGALVEATLEVLEATPEEKRHLGVNALPFETFMETLRLEGTHEDHLLLFREGSPAPAHLLFAALAARQWLRTICTTNFDLLFERAFTAHGVACEVVYRNDDLARAPWQQTTRPTTLIKIHGSVDDLENMAVTLRQVAARSMSRARAEAVRYVFGDSGHDIVLVMGYSASDWFDLNPAVAVHAGSGKRVMVIDHVSGKNEIESLPLTAVASPFRDYAGARLRYDANWLIRELWMRLERTDPPAPPVPLQLLDRWRDDLRRFPPSSKSAVIGSLLFRVAQHQLAVSRYRRSLQGLTNLHARTFLLMKLGNAQRNLGQLREAVASFQEAVSVAKASSDGRALHHALGALAGGLLNLGEVRRAKKLLERALSLAKKTGIDRGELGELHGLLAEASWRSWWGSRRAMQALEDAIDIAREVGDMRGLSGRLGNLAIIHMNKRRHAEAEAALKEARDVSKLAGDTKGEAFVLGSLARLRLDRKDYAEARTLNEQALELFRALGDRQGEARVLGNLGLAWEGLGDNFNAAMCYTDSRRIAIQIGDRQVQQAAELNLARFGIG